MGRREGKLPREHAGKECIVTTCRSERADGESQAKNLPSGDLQPWQITGGICIWQFLHLSSNQQLLCWVWPGGHGMRSAPFLGTMIIRKGKVGEVRGQAY